MSYDYSYCPLVRAPDPVWPLRLPIVCHVAQSHVIQSPLDHQSRTDEDEEVHRDIWAA